ncbi:MAG: hypothetical protein LBB14_02995 [Puniceicoccales bacterium]|jgi:undecaprenyl-diphosphatase|nr:hypothetical protein [Puniceicoccales bacterium]
MALARMGTFLLWAAVLAGSALGRERTPIGDGEAALAGAVQGLAEFLPISSSAHLLLLRELTRGGETPTADRKEALWHFDLLLQLASACAVFAAYPRRTGQLCRGIAGRSREGLRLLGLLLLAFLPAALAGALLDLLRWHPSPGLRALGWPLLLGGAYLLAFEHIFRQRGRRELAELDGRDALFIGAAQTLALFPGVSRSLMSLTAALARGLCPSAAVEFTFFLGGGTIGAAAGHRFFAGGLSTLATFSGKSVAIGCGCAFLCAIPSLFILNHLLRNCTLRPFAYYRILLGLAILAIYC